MIAFCILESLALPSLKQALSRCCAISKQCEYVLKLNPMQIDFILASTFTDCNNSLEICFGAKDC